MIDSVRLTKFIGNAVARTVAVRPTKCVSHLCCVQSHVCGNDAKHITHIPSFCIGIGSVCGCVCVFVNGCVADN